jgi:hypothetical protein
VVLAVKAMCVLLVLLMITSPFQSEAQWQLDMESGLVFAGYNDVRIPGDTGTLISLSDELEIDPSSFFRIRLQYSLGERHTVGVLVAPLRLEAKGTIDRQVTFQDREYAANTQLKSRYRFDSYRATYRYDFLLSDDIQLGLGPTAKVRDASISLVGDNKRSEKKNTGFVPLLHFRCQWTFAEEFGFLLAGDALAAPQGRAEDVLLALNFWPGDKVSFKVGYRILEGGADNDEVYNFTLVHYLIVGAKLTF